MNHSILLENQKKRLNIPVLKLIYFSMFCTWQMGFIYFMAPSLSLNGRTPLPISMDNITLLIATGYVIAIIYMLVFPRRVLLAEKVSSICALITILGLFLPLATDILKLLIYIHVFCCCFMISFETFLIVNYFSENSTIIHLTLAYGIALFLAAIVQNDFFPVSFSVFRILTIIMLTMMLVFFFWFPDTMEILPRYVRKSDHLACPKGFIFSICILIFMSCLMILCGSAAASEIRHGIFASYLMDAVAGIVIFLLYRTKKIHPMRSVSIALGFSVIGFLFLFISFYIPALALPACGLIGIGYIPCQMVPLYGVILMKRYPSRFTAPLCMTLALVTVLIQSSLVEVFHDISQFLILVYLIIVVVLYVIYTQLSPYIINVLYQKPEISLNKVPSETTTLSQLTKREYEVLNLLSLGYSNADIAKTLIISEHTVNDYTKKIYRKLNVHSRHAAAIIFQQNQA